MRTYLIICFLFYIINLAIGQNSIGGVVNAYTKVIELDYAECHHHVIVADDSLFEVGDRVLLIQMQGLDIIATNTSAFGQENGPSAAGIYEFHTVEALISPTVIALGGCNFYEFFDPQNGSLQLIKVPVYEDVELTSTITALPWNGDTGGVLALEVNGTLTMNADMDVSGLGFRGGNTAINNDNNCNFLIAQNDYYYAFDDWRGAAKGEGLATFITGKEHGRGPQANGGGGGNDHNAGGGGGSNGGPGGDGGNNTEPSTFGCDGFFPGLGGVVPSSDSSVFQMGGGGGAGHGNNGNATAGGNGGGIAIIVADTIISQGYTVRANGFAVPMGGGDGGGGGGAGGTVGLRANVLIDSFRVECNGGTGGSIDNQNANRCHGPGGGGGAGYFYTNLPTITPVAVDLQGGAAGQTLNSTVCENETNDAEPGTTASPVFNAVVNSIFDCSSEPVVQAGFNFTVNSNGNVDFINTSQNSQSSQWDFAGLDMSSEDNPTFTFPEAGAYDVTLIVTDGCFADTITQSIVIPEFEPPSIAFTLDDGNGCAPHVVQFQNQSSGTIESLEWTFEGGTPASSTDPNPLILYDTPGVYDVQLQLNGSILIQPDLIEVLPAVEASFAYDIEENTVTFINNSANASSYEWDFGDGTANSFEENPTHTYIIPGTYNVTLIATSAYCGKAITESVFVDFTSTLSEQQKTDIKISPNPTRRLVYVETESIDNYSLILRTLTGTRLSPLIQYSTRGASIDLNELSAGIYFLTLQSKTQSHVFKLIKLD